MPATVASVLRRKEHDLWTLTLAATVYEAIEMMADRSAGALLVLSEGTLAGNYPA